MTHYQIKIPGQDLTDMVHEMSTQIITGVAAAARGEVRDLNAYPDIFRACKENLRKYVRGFHVCGCRPHCDMESQPVGLPGRSPVGKSSLMPPGTQRYVLTLDIPLLDFARALEVEIQRIVAKDLPVKNWHKKLFPAIREGVETTLGRYLYYSPTCNRGEYLCEVGACTEFDPWERVHPKGGS